jgi:Transposase DDE domain
MERELWPRIYRELQEVARGTQQKHAHFHPWVIAAVLLWAAIHDRPVNWACNVQNWSTTTLRPPEIPSESTMSRRPKKVVFGVFLNQLAARLREDGPAERELIIDGKPLPVGHCSKDPDARAGPLGRGYKLHAIWGYGCLPDAWEVTAAREYEGDVAVRLFRQIRGQGILLADGNYESSQLYDAASASGYQLVARPDSRDTGLGHRYQSPKRLIALGWFEEGLGWKLYRGRTGIERSFGNAGSFAGGLCPLPNWVRRLDRVSRWVWCKLFINAHRILQKQEPLVINAHRILQKHQHLQQMQSVERPGKTIKQSYAP